MSALTDFNDLHVVQGKEAVRSTVLAAKPVGVPNDGEWPDPMIPGATPLPEIPASLLPCWVGDMALAVADSTQTPPAMAVMLALSVLATVVQRRWEVVPFGGEDEYTEPLSLWTLTAMPSGARKTAVINALTDPLMHWEKLERDRLRREIVAINAARAVAKKRIEKLIRDASNADNDDARVRIRQEIEREEEGMPAEIYAPKLFTGDVTSERLQSLLVMQGERMAVLTDEAGIFLIMSGIYSGGSASIDVFLQAHAGSPGRPSEYDTEACINWLIEREVRKVQTERPQDRLARVQADKIEMENAERRQVLIPADQLEPKLRAAMVAARELWRNEPARLAREVPGKPIKEIEELLAVAFDDFLVELSRWPVRQRSIA